MMSGEHKMRSIAAARFAPRGRLPIWVHTSLGNFRGVYDLHVFIRLLPPPMCLTVRGPEARTGGLVARDEELAMGDWPLIGTISHLEQVRAPQFERRRIDVHFVLDFVAL